MVEIIITVTIMGILLVLAVVNLNATQVKARDDERRADVEAIASAFETYYQRGTLTADPGSYPGTSTSNSSNNTIRSNIENDISIQSLLAPGVNDPTKSLISATNSTQTATGVTPQPTVDQYVYQPLRADGTLCTSSSLICRKFNIFYRLEADNTVYKFMSRSQ